MSNATVRAKRPFAATRSSQSRAEPGLPCTKTTAVRAWGGPAWITRVLTPPTLIRLSRTPAGGLGSPSRTVCSAAVAAPAAPPSPTQYCEGSGSSPRAGVATRRAIRAAAAAVPLMGWRYPDSAPRNRRKDRDLVAVLDRRVEPVEEADVLAAHVDVHEAAQVTVHRDPVAEAVVAVVEAVEHLAD